MAGHANTDHYPRWGVRFDAARPDRGELALLPADLPQAVVMPLLQHTGRPADACVEPGQQVLTGEPIGRLPSHSLGAAVHAPVSGTVTRISAGPSTGRGDCLRVHIESDGRDARWDGYPVHADPLRLPTRELRRAVIDGGIAGLGGAAFPAGVKLNKGTGVTTLIINGAECEPCINCDDALMREEPGPILLGAQIMMRILEADACLIAIKEDMHAARESMSAAVQALGDDRMQVVAVPPVYPAGGEAQLIELLTGREIPAGGLPWDSGALCQNVGTASAVARMLTAGEPLISRIVTVTGGGVAAPANFRARLGTPIRELIRCAGGYRDEPAGIVMGGPMMGTPLPGDDLPVTKATNCIYVPTAAEIDSAGPELPCIRCGDCATACPVDLMPQMLLQARRVNDLDRLLELGLHDCIECRCCDYVCPSRIPLTRGFVASKHQLWERALEQRRAERAGQRFMAREARIQRQRQSEESELQQQTERLAAGPDAERAALDALLNRVDRPDGDPPRDD